MAHVPLGRRDPARFGLSFTNESGLWFNAQNLLRDLASLNRMEMLPWDVWGWMPEPDAVLSLTLVADHLDDERSA